MSKLTKELNKLKTKAFKEGTKANNIQDFFTFGKTIRYQI